MKSIMFFNSFDALKYYYNKHSHLHPQSLYLRWSEDECEDKMVDGIHGYILAVPDKGYAHVQAAQPVNGKTSCVALLRKFS